MEMNPMHQFEVYRIGPEIKLGGVNLSFTNASLFMTISSITILLLLFFALFFLRFFFAISKRVDISLIFFITFLIKQQALQLFVNLQKQVG